MKIRNGFVSNSSSTSFVVIGKQKPTTEGLDTREGILYIGPSGDGTSDCCFGWEVEDRTTVYERINFAYIQCLDTQNEELKNIRLQMFSKVIKDFTGVDFQWCAAARDYFYIDHASSACEDVNVEIFDDEETLKRFMFSPDSYIHTDNDNYSQWDD